MSKWGKLSDFAGKKTAANSDSASVNVEIPFDLNAVISVNVDYKVLKDIIEHLFK
jgi:hypothetical protein